jgi:hypothetical protein
MAASEIEICNAALALVGQQQIQEFGDNSDSERYCKVLYGLSRDALIRMHPWNFCIKRSKLQQLSETPAFEFTHTYELPADYIRTIDLYATNSDYRVVAGQKLLCDDSTVSLTYVAGETDVTKFDALFTQALIYYLAAQLAVVLAHKQGLQPQLLSVYNQLIKQAKQVDGQEGTPGKIRIIEDWRSAKRRGSRSNKWTRY